MQQPEISIHPLIGRLPIIYHGRHHVGISNIKRRLALMYGERASITCSNMDENYGAVVEVRLPKTE